MCMSTPKAAPIPKRAPAPAAAPDALATPDAGDPSSKVKKKAKGSKKLRRGSSGLQIKGSGSTGTNVNS